MDIISPFSNIGLSKRQQNILNKLSEYGSQAIFKKREVNMLDLAALTASEGVEFAMFTRKGERLIVRGDNKETPLRREDLIRLRDDGYRWSGHTHITTGDVSLMPSEGDMRALQILDQKNSAIYNAEGKYGLIIPLERNDGNGK